MPDGLNAFLESVSLVSDADSMEEAPEALTLITLHQAKGLEYPVVFMVGMEDGLLPHARSLDEEAGLEEERRLCYVGMTRAKERLYLTRAFRRGFRGGTGPNLPSRFLLDIPRELVAGQEQPKPSPQNGSAEADRPSASRNSELDLGDLADLPLPRPEGGVLPRLSEVPRLSRVTRYGTRLLVKES